MSREAFLKDSIQFLKNFSFRNAIIRVEFIGRINKILTRFEMHYIIVLIVILVQNFLQIFSDFCDKFARFASFISCEEIEAHEELESHVFLVV